MALDYQVRRSAKRCSVSGREFDRGESFFSCLKEELNEITRVDFAAEHWKGPPHEAIGWWRTRLAKSGSAPALAPSEVLLGLMQQWGADTQWATHRYLLGLLLVRRRLLRVEPSPVLPETSVVADAPLEEESAATCIRLSHPASGATFDVMESLPSPDEAQEVEARLLELIRAETE